MRLFSLASLGGRARVTACAVAFLCGLLMADPEIPIAHELLLPTLPTPFAGALTAGPYNFEFSPDENLRLTSFNSLVGVTIAVRGRIKRPDQTIGDIAFEQVPNTDRTAKVTDFPIGPGYLLNLSVFASSGAPKIGQTFNRVQIIRGKSGATMPIGTLVQGYITSSQDRAWPGSPIETSFMGGGCVREILGTTPAAGNPVNEVCPTGARWELMALRTILTTDPTIIARRPRMRLTGATFIVAGINSPATLPASSASTFYWMQGMPMTVGIGNDHFAQGIPSRMQIVAGGNIEVGGENIQAGDQFSAPSYQVIEWLEAA